MMLQPKLPPIGIVAILLGTLGGCNNGHELPTAPVEVTVTLDGRPVEKGGVQFYPVRGRHAKGSLRPDGTATLGTYSQSDGATIGKHRIAVVSVEQVPSQDPSEPLPQHKWLTPERYGSSDTSGLEVEVVQGKTNRVLVELATDGEGRVTLE